MPDLINYSEFNTLTDCERKFVYAYVLNQEEQGARRGLHLGTLCHLWHSRWLTGPGATLPMEWTDDINTGGKPGEVRTLRLSDFDSDLVERATWLAGRFVAVYGVQPPSSWTVISAEEWLTRPFTWGTLVGRTDGFVEIDGNLWLIEVKSFGSRPGPLAYAQVSPQLGCYSLLAEEKFGKRPFGVLYQGIHTYQWKPQVPTQAALIEQAIAANVSADGSPVAVLKKADQRAWAKARQADPNTWTQRPPEESFEQLEVELGDEHLRTAQAYLRSAVHRRSELLDERGLVLALNKPEALLDRALPNVGQGCKNCGFKPQCWNDLGGVEEFEIEVLDDDAEPV